jgi:hypothetical protein
MNYDRHAHIEELKETERKIDESQAKLRKMKPAYDEYVMEEIHLLELQTRLRELQ